MPREPVPEEPIISLRIMRIRADMAVGYAAAGAL
jgi:hypothetical protein